MKKSVKIAIIAPLAIVVLLGLFGLDVLKIFDPVNCSNVEEKIRKVDADFEKWVSDGNDPYSYDRMKMLDKVELLKVMKKCIVQAND